MFRSFFVTRVSSQRRTSASLKALMALSETSPMLPIGVGTRDNKLKSLGLFFSVASVKFLDSTSRVDHSFRTCKEWVTFATDVDFKRVLRRFVFKSVSARASYGTSYKVRV